MKNLLCACFFGALLAPNAHAASLTLSKLDLTGAAPGTKTDVDAPIGDMDNLYLVDLSTGRIDIYDKASSTVSATPLLSEVPNVDRMQVYGVAFHPDYGNSGKDGFGKYYVSYSENASRTTTGATILAEFTAGSDTPREVLRASQGPTDPSAAGRHLGSDIGFGPDGYLYMTTGDAGGSPTGPNPAQDVTDLNGKILRIDPLQSGPDPYTVPADNPDFGVGARPELWAIGTRNPFRANFDPLTGLLYFGDVGEDGFEEINVGVAGANYGWNYKEGFATGPNTGIPPIDLTDPIYSYGHGNGPFEGISVTGGSVYRGALSDLFGQYFFGDFQDAYSSDTVKSIWSFDVDDGLPATDSLRRWTLNTGADTLDGLVSFSTGQDGSLYLLDFDGDVFQVVSAQIPLPAPILFLSAALLALPLQRMRS